MFGQGSLGAAALGQPEEFPAVAPIPAEARVWFTVEPDVNVTVNIVYTNEEDFG